MGGIMKKYLLTLALMVFAVSAYGAEIKIAYVDLNKALNESNSGKNAVGMLEEMVKSKQGAISDIGEKIKVLEDELSKQASILTPESVKTKKNEREVLLRDYQRMVKDSQDEVQKKQAEFMDVIVNDIREVVIKLGREGNYTVIFEKAESGMLYYSSEIDITDQVISSFNKSSSVKGN